MRRYVVAGVMAWVAVLGLAASADASLVGYWNFDQSGSLGLCSVSGATLSVAGNAQFEAGGYAGGALRLDGNGDYLWHDPASSLPSGIPIGNGSYTLAAFIQTSSAANQGILGWGNFGSSGQVNALRTHGAALLNYGWGTANDYSAAAPTIYNGQWHHVAATYDSATRTKRLYFDGVEIGGGMTLTGDLNVGAANFRIGSTNNAEYFNGLLDDVGVWQTALSAPRVKALHGLAQRAEFQYDLGQSQQLFDHYDTGASGGALQLAGGWRWQYAEGLTTDPGVVTEQGGHYYVRLGDDGTGLHAAPRSAPPAGRAGLKLWLNAGAGAESAAGTPATDGAAVQSWRDQSDNAILASQGTAANRPTYVASVANLNQQPALSFDGNDSLGGTLTELASNPDMSVFIVWDRDGAATQAAFGVGSSNAAHGSVGVGWNGAGHYNIFQWTGPEGHVYSSAADPVLETALRNTADANRMSVFLNGQAGTLSQTGANANVNGSFKIGQHSHTGLPVVGKIAEVVFYDRVLNTAERIVTENYLGAKYAIPLHVSSNRFSYAAPEKGDYDFDLIGIGREADGALTAGSAAGLTLSEWNGGLSNGDYLLAAHKTTVNSLVASRLPADMRWRWDRVWAMEMTGEADATLSFDFTELLANLSESSLAELVDGSTALGLLYTATDGADFERLNLNSSVDGDVVSFNMVSSQWADGYYTIGFIPEPSAIVLAALGLLSLLARRPRRASA